MTRREHLQNLRFLAVAYMQDRAAAAQIAAELGSAVASLNGVLPDDGRAIAFAAAALLFAGCAGMRQHTFDTMQREVSAALRAMGERT